VAHRLQPNQAKPSGPGDSDSSCHILQLSYSWYYLSMQKVVTAGGIIIKDESVLLIRKGSKFAIPKGHLEGNETVEVAAIRELAEETSTKVSIIKSIGSVSREATEDDGETVMKEIVLFLMKSEGKLDTQAEENYEWVHLSNISEDSMKFKEEAKFLVNFINDEIAA
jgi:ADP-ribose pyrophosphatase YjhB (NUDIX family)